MIRVKNDLIVIREKKINIYINRIHLKSSGWKNLRIAIEIIIPCVHFVRIYLEFILIFYRRSTRAREFKARPEDEDEDEEEEGNSDAVYTIAEHAAETFLYINLCFSGKQKSMVYGSSRAALPLPPGGLDRVLDNID